jgi:hypothetical protein
MNSSPSPLLWYENFSAVKKPFPTAAACRGPLQQTAQIILYDYLIWDFEKEQLGS